MKPVYVPVCLCDFLLLLLYSLFGQQFREYAQTIRAATDFSWRSILGATRGLSEVLTSQAIQTNRTWPFVTLDSFEVLVRNTRLLGQSELVVLAPLVATSQIEAWNAYSNTHQDWIDQSFAAMGQTRDDLNPIPSSVFRFGRYKGRTVLSPETADDPYNQAQGNVVAPFWQMSRPPFDTSIVNFNALSDVTHAELYQALHQAQTWVLGRAGPNHLLHYTLSEAGHDALHLAPDTNVTGYANQHPHTALVYPVWKNALVPQDDQAQVTDTNPGTLVAMILNILPWDKLLQHVLPDGVEGIDCVLRNNVGQAFSYRILGSVATYMGAGDHYHSREFEEQAVSWDFANPQDTNQAHIFYSMTLYPSAALHDTHTNTMPVVMAVGVAIIFLAMMITFALYDAHVVRKNNKIVDAAANSNAILAVSMRKWRHELNLEHASKSCVTHPFSASIIRDSLSFPKM